MTFAWLAQRGSSDFDWVEIIILAVIFGGGFIAQMLKKVIEAIKEKKARESEAGGTGQTPPPMQAGDRTQPPTAKPLPPRIGRAQPTPTARPLPPGTAASESQRPAPVARPVPPVPEVAPPRQGPAMPTVVLLDEDAPSRSVKRQPLASEAAEMRVSEARKEKPGRKQAASDRESDRFHTADRLGHVDPEAHLGHLVDDEGRGKRRKRPHRGGPLKELLTGDGLRRAILMSEVLGPPLALRGADNRDPWDG